MIAHHFDAIEAVGVCASVIGLLVGGVKWLTAVFAKVTETNRNITLLTTNHLPHIQMSLDAHSKALLEVTSDVRDMDTKITGYSQRLDDTKASVDMLHSAFLEHLEVGDR